MTVTLAPMEGITNYIYRQTFHKYFPGISRFYTPFLSPNQNLTFTTREWNEIDPAHNDGLDVVPQLLARNPDHFIWACHQLESLGYSQVNLNLGCPSGTVVAKKKGSGFLSVPMELDLFLEKVFAQVSIRISVKTRLGVNSPEEFPALLKIFSDYPICDLIIHPRIRKEFYKGDVHHDWFSYACGNYTGPLSYNGNLFSAKDIHYIMYHFPDIQSIMLGRGAIANPALHMEYLGTGTRDLARLSAFHHELVQQYSAVLYGENAVLCRMKELWTYMLPTFTNEERYTKPLRKCQHLSDYRLLTDRLFRQEQLLPPSSI